MKNLKTVLILFLIILLLGGLVIVSYFMNNVPENPTGTIGNTAGNLYNDGLFCENEGIVYFSNPYDENTLYSMNVDETNLKKLTTVGVKSINSAGKFVYFYQDSIGDGSGLGYAVKNTGMYRLDTKTDKFLCLKRDPVATLNLIDNNIFYQHFNGSQGVFLDKISIDKETEATIFQGTVSPACAIESVIYYANPDDNYYLYSYNTLSNTKSLFWMHRVYNPIYHTDGYIYFMDMETEYQLHRYHPGSDTHEILTTDRLENFNVYGDYIYYQKFSETQPALMRMRTDGSGMEVVAYGNFENINITSNYVYFTEYDSPTPVYQQELYGPVNTRVFNPMPEE